MEQDAETAVSSEILNWIKYSNIQRFTKSDILLAFKNRKIGKAEILNQALKNLEQHHIITATVDQSTAKPTTVYRVSGRVVSSSYAS